MPLLRNNATVPFFAFFSKSWLQYLSKTYLELKPIVFSIEPYHRNFKWRAAMSMQIFVEHSAFVVKLSEQLIVDNEMFNENLHRISSAQPINMKFLQHPS